MWNYNFPFLLFKRHAIKLHVVPLCLFLKQLASLFPDRTAVLNSSWHLLSPIPKITKIKNNLTDWEGLAAFIVAKQQWMFALKQTDTFLAFPQGRLRAGFNKMSAVITQATLKDYLLRNSTSCTLDAEVNTGLMRKAPERQFTSRVLHPRALSRTRIRCHDLPDLPLATKSLIE